MIYTVLFHTFNQTKNMNAYIIQEPNRELTEGYFTALMKYSLAFLIAWMFGQLIIFTYPFIAWSGEKKQFPEIENLVEKLNKHIA